MDQPRAPVPLPRRFSLVRQGDALELSWRWVLAHPYAAAGTLFLAALPWGAVLARPRLLEERVAWVVSILVSLFLGWVALSFLLNRTTIRIRSQRPSAGGAYREGAAIRVLTIDHGPIPFGERVTLPVEAIEQLFCTKVRHFYEVHATVAGGRSIRLLDLLETREQALFVEQELEAALRINDVPRAGELAR